MKAAIYTRYSDAEKQTDKSIEDQVALCRALCQREGLTVSALYDDRGISGASKVNRLGLQRLLRDAQAGKFEVVVAESLDRIARDLEDSAGIYKRLKFAGVAVITAADGVVGDIHVGVKGLLGALFLKDLAQKTHRGQAGVIRDGRHNGGRSYGYKPVLGQNGKLEIVEAEAEIVREIFADYLGGKSPRDIAIALNKRGVKGPRGGAWNASTINGSRERRNGILQNELYAGKIVWNRQHFVKDPDTGKRLSRANPPDKWMTAEAEDLRIVDADTFAQVQARKVARAGIKSKTRKTHLLSGLTKCGCCGSGYIVSGKDKRGLVLICSRMKETGLCDNKRTVGLEAIENLVLRGIEEKLGDPDIVGEYVREYHRTMRELNSQSEGRRRSIEKRLGNVNSAIAKLVDMMLASTASRALHDRLAALETERDAIEAERDAVAVEPVEFHPNAAEAYRTKIKALRKAIDAANADDREAAIVAIREIVEKIVIRPQGPYKPIEVDIYGQLAAILQLSEVAAGKALVGESRGVMVAGTRNTHTPRLPPLMISVVNRDFPAEKRSARR